MHWLAEGYLPRAAADDVAAIAERVRGAAESLGREGVPVRYVQTAFLPEDEVCLHLFESRAAADVAETLRRAALAVDRIVQARPGGPGGRATVSPPSSERTTNDRGGDSS